MKNLLINQRKLLELKNGIEKADIHSNLREIIESTNGDVLFASCDGGCPNSCYYGCLTGCKSGCLCAVNR